MTKRPKRRPTMNSTTDSRQRNNSNSNRTLILYSLLLCLRLICTISPGYVHPDEFFQGGQELFFPFPPSSSSSTTKDRRRYSPPILGGTFYDLHRTAPWEYRRNHAVRSILPPTVLTLLPLRVYSLLRDVIIGGGSSSAEVEWKDAVNGTEIWIVPRISLAFLSILTIDLPLWYLLRLLPPRSTGGIVVPEGVLLLASSWTTLTFLTRPFSNSLETFCLSLLLLVVLYDVRKSGGTVGVPSLVGGICSVGVFTRFTFGIFAFPVVVACLHRRGRTISPASSNDDDGSSRVRGASYYVASVTYDLLWIGTSFLYSSMILLRMDHTFYDSWKDDSADEMVPILTPWNALLYNSDADNLSKHGLHSRILHVVVNMPMLYGPLVLWFYYTTVRSLMNGRRENGDERGGDSVREGEEDFVGIVRSTCRAVIWCGLGVLSCAPHQEPRFLLPLTVPLILSYECRGYGSRHESSSSSSSSSHRDEGGEKKKDDFDIGGDGSGGGCSMFTIVWIGFNIILMVFFGILHQGGVIPSLLNLSDRIHSHEPMSYATKEGGLSQEYEGKGSLRPPPVAILYYHTYMPMTFLLQEGVGRGTNAVDGDNPNIHVPVIDLKGSDHSALVQTVHDVLPCKRKGKQTDTSHKIEGKGEESKYVYLVTPRAALRNADMYHDGSKGNRSCAFLGTTRYRCEDVEQFFQISTEDVPRWRGSLDRFVSDMKLVIYEIRCS